MDKKKLITWLLFFTVIFLGLQLLNPAKPAQQNPESTASVTISATKDSYAVDEAVSVKVKNNTEEAITLPKTCPTNPLTVSTLAGDSFTEKTATAAISCDEVTPTTINPGEETTINFEYWNHSLFGEVGQYRVSLTLPSGDPEGEPQTFSSASFNVEQAGVVKRFFRAAFYQPIYNALIFIVSVIPYHDLGFAIIILTLIIRLILLVPSQRAIVSQKRMQELQPKLTRLRKEHEGNQEKIAQETMKLWKEHKVNPFGSCLPLLIQFPFLIAIFYVVQSGLNPDNAYLLYSPLQHFNLQSIQTLFLGILDLRKVDHFVLPLIVGLLQFGQMKLAMAQKKEKDESRKESRKHKDKKEKKPLAGSEMEIANKAMIYIMPVMIAGFSATLPAGVGLYWGVSTLFALVQQLVANRK
ncbi:hypothetical protein CO046_04620 [Candidatus Peregrinibacteria bacterium CG_4_9_14_0_2_um_filter_53_11]|nr:MAG: hypothetical protein CO046_04620 [Candidatus Peregrinibacteria bacterium CG_4_9_14_0_2_um_filter_53_11]